MEPFLGHWRASSPSTPHLRSRPPESGSHQRRVGRQGCSRALLSSLCPGVDYSSTPPRWFCPNLGWRECGQLRSVIRESPCGRPGDLRDGDREWVPRTDAGISEGRSRRASSGPQEAWRAGSHRSSPRSDLHPPRASVRSFLPAYLILPPAEGKGTPPPPTLRCD